MSPATIKPPIANSIALVGSGMAPTEEPITSVTASGSPVSRTGDRETGSGRRSDARSDDGSCQQGACAREASANLVCKPGSEDEQVSHRESPLRSERTPGDELSEFKTPAACSFANAGIWAASLLDSSRADAFLRQLLETPVAGGLPSRTGSLNREPVGGSQSRIERVAILITRIPFRGKRNLLPPRQSSQLQASNYHADTHRRHGRVSERACDLASRAAKEVGDKMPRMSARRRKVRQSMAVFVVKEVVKV